MSTKRKILIGIDPGHGGNSSGTYSYNTTKDKLFEKDYALELSFLIRDRLLKNGFDVFMTRTGDVNSGNVSKRAKMCVDAKCNFAFSLHFNGFDDEKANGTEVFVPYAEKLGGIEAGFYKELGKYFRRREPFARSNSYYDRNKTFDKKLNVETRRFEAATNGKDYFGFIRTAWEQGLSADLLEICFLTNKNDFETYIKFKEEIADGIAKSIVEGFGKKYKTEKKKILFGVEVTGIEQEAIAETLENHLKTQGYEAEVFEYEKEL